MRSADKERGRGAGAELGGGTRYALLGPSDQLQGGGAWGGQGTDVCVCVPSQGKDKQSALHKASENGLAGTVAALLAHGANVALADEVRTCVYARTHDDTHKQSILLGKGMYMHEDMVMHI